MTSRISSYWNLHRLSILIVLASLLLYASFGYDLERTDFIKLSTLVFALFFFCYKLIQFEKWNFNFLLVAGILFRLIFLMAEPNLSQDFYRFIWDGELVLAGINPYLQTPDMIMESGEILLANAQELHNGMGSLSARNYSNYPPLNQFLFAIAAFLGGKSIMGSVIAMRSIIILADIGVYYFGKKLLRFVNRSPHLIFWYFLNPLVVIELTGNLHFEGVMLFFFIWGLCLLSANKWLFAAVAFAFSISIKLIPLMFLPLFSSHFGFIKSLKFYIILGLTLLIGVVPFYSPLFLTNYTDTIALWFSNFEFNAGLYNLIKEIAVNLDVKPWELIKIYGKVVPYIVISFVLLLTFIRKNKKLTVLINSMFWVMTLYYFLSSTVHPWYIVFLLGLSVFTDYRFPIIWSLVIILSYYAYSNPEFEENLGILLIEYIIVFVFMIYEIFRLKGLKLLIRKN
ncbi:polyprenol phosphomannose-dependent alpha 1,6 mannosyltransferase MptB [uncultured Eudoraea sp.]|uniref:polyprenol phosphomannose-dependent alpha 1,6 mannosyltransferase MptB n=1 Tax=uncultured Eudoraea sp. TaxID=1035614 RepID=UPI0026033930|nr:polyprenol phosphomannose-dependent alpha 1,6 mannosyltransferase MptB [uncultured Eudoraea sp.]